MQLMKGPLAIALNNARTRLAKLTKGRANWHIGEQNWMMAKGGIEGMMFYAQIGMFWWRQPEMQAYQALWTVDTLQGTNGSELGSGCATQIRRHADLR